MLERGHCNFTPLYIFLLELLFGHLLKPYGTTWHPAERRCVLAFIAMLLAHGFKVRRTELPGNVSSGLEE